MVCVRLPAVKFKAGPSHGLGTGVRPLRSLRGAGRLLGVLGQKGAVTTVRPRHFSKVQRLSLCTTARLVVLTAYKWFFDCVHYQENPFGCFDCVQSEQCIKCGKMPSARNARAVAAARSSQRYMRMASPRRFGRGSAEFRRPSDGKHEGSRNRPSDDPGPCRRCAAALSCSADAPTCITLGSHAKSGPRLRRSPQRAVPCGHRNGASLSPTDAPKPAAWRKGSAHPDHRLRGWNRVASPRRDGRIPAAFRRPSDADTKSPESSTR